MTTDHQRMAEAERLEQLWSSQFGDAYIERNRAAANRRGPFWQAMLTELRPRSVLEVGCNIGANLSWVTLQVPPRNVYGVDINLRALVELHQALPEIGVLWGRARELPFRDGWFDLVFTMGVLIHQPEGALPSVMGEIVRCSRRYILCGEYYAEHTTEVPYRGQARALFKRDYGGIYQDLFSELLLCRQGFLGREEGWDDVTYWVFEKS